MIHGFQVSDLGQKTSVKVLFKRERAASLSLGFHLQGNISDRTIPLSYSISREVPESRDLLSFGCNKQDPKLLKNKIL